MSKNIVAAALGAVLVMGMNAEAVSAETKSTMTKPPKLMKGLEKCYGIAKAGQNDCSTGSLTCAGESKLDSDPNAWITLPKGTCNKIVGASTQPPKTTG